MSDKMCLCREWKEQFPYIVKAERINTTGYVKCTVCMTEFSVANNGRTSIIRHIGTSKHQKAVNTASSSLNLLTS